MKRINTAARIAALIFGALIMAFGCFTVTAEPDDPVSPRGDQTDDPPVWVSPAETQENPYEDPYADPYAETEDPWSVYTVPEETEPVTYYYETTVPVTEEPTEAATEYVISYYEYQEPVPTEYAVPTLPKTVSKKTYSTNYTAGIISWACVGVGVIVMLTTFISTKLSGS